MVAFNIVFIGNPGNGKSTLLNCLVEMQHATLEFPFKSGRSYGEGLTDKFEQKTFGEITYMDTPGLADVTKGAKAASSITQALKKGGEYCIVFVMNQQSGKIAPSEYDTAQRVLKSVPQIKAYGVIVNKMSKKVIKLYQKQNKVVELKKKLVEMNPNKSVSVLLLPNIKELEDGENITIPLPQLKVFVKNLPRNTITSVSELKTSEALKKAQLEEKVREKQRLEEEKRRIEEEARRAKFAREEALKRQKKQEAQRAEKRRLLEAEKERQREERLHQADIQRVREKEAAERERLAWEAEFEKKMREEAKRMEEILKPHQRQEEQRRQREEERRIQRGKELRQLERQNGIVTNIITSPLRLFGI